jgi:hypothetical protein
LFILIWALMGISLGQSQENEPSAGQTPSPAVPKIHYALVGESSGIQVAIDLDKFVLEWFEKNVEGFDQMGQAEKDEIARRLLADGSLDYVDIRLVNRAGRNIGMNIASDSLTVSFKKVQTKYKPDTEDTSYPSQLLEDSEADVRFPIATTTDAKMGIGRLAASLSRIDYLIRKELERARAPDPTRAGETTAERPEIRMAPIARSILEQDLFGEVFLAEEGIAVPLVFRVSTTDVDEPAAAR